MIGKTISHYRITAAIGAGGMGEVYRATDTKLGRDVALKVLPAAFANDTQRMARFQREAQVLASLNHPHVASIYGLEESGPTRALVMELVEGATLAERVTHGPLTLEEALPIARQIAEALEAAHERGIIHRDLKPANIKITPEGEVKVLDFGLAKAVDSEDSAADISNSPTLTAAATQAGMILGTAAYMSPEQARGKKVDKRADIWAFGGVLYEMLTGRRAFEGETTSDTLAAVLKTEPNWDALPTAIPANIRRLLKRCLQKDPKLRLRDIGEARIAIEESLGGTADVVAAGW
jgi:serine/threonine protein kinase